MDSVGYSEARFNEIINNVKVLNLVTTNTK